MKHTEKQLRAQRSFIIAELSRLSRDGWSHAKPCDYEPLEHALARIDAKLHIISATH